MLSGKYCLTRLLHASAIGLALGTALVTNLSADSVTLAPAADTFLPQFVEHFPGANGFSTDMVIGTQGANAGFARNRGLVRFDLSAIPAGSVVNSVTLQVSVNKVASGGPASRFHLHRLLVAWAESDSTWAVRLPGQNWATPGGEAGTEYSTTSSANTLVAGAGIFAFASTAGLVGDVTDWLNQPSANQGWLFKTEDESVPFTAGRFAASENPGSAPQLTVDFTPPDLPFHIDSTGIEGTNFCLGFHARTGKTYVVERRGRVETGAWINVRTLPPAEADGPVTVCDPLRGGNWFYRVGEQ